MGQLSQQPPKEGRQKLSLKRCITPAKTTLPLGGHEKDLKNPVKFTRVVLQQFGKPEEYALSPTRKTTNRPTPGINRFDVQRQKQIIQARENRMSPKSLTHKTNMKARKATS
jgi:hypothetical protein